jgi:glycosyltransferase involved in cell wall biosynthesis
MKKRILYVQYTNPAVYPPLQHSSGILADAGWNVLFLGTGAYGTDSLKFPYHEKIRVKQLPYCPAGWRQKVHYGRFALWVLCWGVLNWPSWIYASNPLSSPIALILSFLPGTRIIYHEHESPLNTIEERNTLFKRLVLWTRQMLARRAVCCILPNEYLRLQFKSEVHKDVKVFCVWNCPRKSEVIPQKKTWKKNRLSLVYQGSIVPERLPIAVIEALSMMPEYVNLRVIGYETAGNIGYVQTLRRAASRLGVTDRVEFLGTLPSREELLNSCRKCDVGLALLPKDNRYMTAQNMFGGSTKVFDYLACGLALLLTDLPDSHKLLVDRGHGLTCDPGDPRSIAEASNRFLEHPEEMRLMGEKGRKRISEEWNYESQFRPVFKMLNNDIHLT